MKTKFLNLTNFFLFINVFCGLNFVQFIYSQTKPDDSKNSYSESIPYKQKSKDKKNQAKDNSDNSENSKKKSEINNEIIVPTAIFDKTGKPVKSLEKADFQILVDDVAVLISKFEIVREPLNLILIIDLSPSTADKLKDLKKFASILVNNLDAADRVQIIGFHEKCIVLTDLTNDHKVLEKAINKLELGEGTSLYETIQVIQKQKKSNDILKTVVLLTDGVDSTSATSNYKSTLAATEKSDSIIHSIYIDTLNDIKNSSRVPYGYPNAPQMANLKSEYELGINYLNDLASISGGSFIKFKDFSKINENDVTSLLDYIRPQYVLSFFDNENLKQNKQIKVRINRANLIVKARGSYLVK